MHQKPNRKKAKPKGNPYLMAATPDLLKKKKKRRKKKKKREKKPAQLSYMCPAAYCCWLCIFLAPLARLVA
jgi:hypothetical protein